jgi:microcystin-dependent protein
MPRSFGTTNAQRFADPPAVGVAGDLYFNTTSSTIFVSDGSAWQPVGVPGPHTQLSDLAGRHSYYGQDPPTQTPRDGWLWFRPNASGIQPLQFRAGIMSQNLVHVPRVDRFASFNEIGIAPRTVQNGVYTLDSEPNNGVTRFFARVTAPTANAAGLAFWGNPNSNQAAVTPLRGGGLALPAGAANLQINAQIRYNRQLAASTQCGPTVRFANAAGAWVAAAVSSRLAIAASNVWTLVSRSIVIPAGAVAVYLMFDTNMTNAQTTIGDWLDIAEVCVNVDGYATYFDGDGPSSFWLGETNASQSRLEIGTWQQIDLATSFLGGAMPEGSLRGQIWYRTSPNGLMRQRWEPPATNMATRPQPNAFTGAGVLIGLNTNVAAAGYTRTANLSEPDPDWPGRTIIYARNQHTAAIANANLWHYGLQQGNNQTNQRVNSFLVTPGQPVYVGFRYRISMQAPDQAPFFRIIFNQFDAARAANLAIVNVDTPPVVPDGQWRRTGVWFTPGEGVGALAQFIRVQGFDLANATIGDYWDVTDLIVSFETDHYFDGNYPNANWTGTALQSTSEAGGWRPLGDADLTAWSLRLWQQEFDWSASEGGPVAGWYQYRCASTAAVVNQALFLDSVQFDWRTGIAEIVVNRTWTVLDSAYYQVKFDDTATPVGTAWTRLVPVIGANATTFNLEVRQRTVGSTVVLDMRVRTYQALPDSGFRVLVRAHGAFGFAAPTTSRPQAPGTVMTDAEPASSFAGCLLGVPLTLPNSPAGAGPSFATNPSLRWQPPSPAVIAAGIHQFSTGNRALAITGPNDLSNGTPSAVYLQAADALGGLFHMVPGRPATGYPGAMAIVRGGTFGKALMLRPTTDDVSRMVVSDQTDELRARSELREDALRFYDSSGNLIGQPVNGMTGSGGGGGVPAGVIEMFGGTVAPAGYVLCNGASYATAAQPTLFAAIGYTWGGSGANFNVPNFIDRVPRGSATPGTTGGSATHTHTLSAHTHSVAAHTHTLSAHTHTSASHAHTGPSHSHAHTHGSHDHSLDVGNNFARVRLVAADAIVGINSNTSAPSWNQTAHVNASTPGSTTTARTVGASLGGNAGAATPTSDSTLGGTGATGGATVTTAGPSTDATGSATTPAGGGPSTDATSATDSWPPWGGVPFIIKT